MSEDGTRVVETDNIQHAPFNVDVQLDDVEDHIHGTESDGDYWPNASQNNREADPEYPSSQSHLIPPVEAPQRVAQSFAKQWQAAKMPCNGTAKTVVTALPGRWRVRIKMLTPAVTVYLAPSRATATIDGMWAKALINTDLEWTLHTSGEVHAIATAPCVLEIVEEMNLC